jgi:diadenosine tetraphosphate (Ap4A) HIT family hydrolase
MTHRVALVSCVKSKRPDPAPARDLYTSALFDGFRTYAEANADSWYILSAEHGLLHPDEVVTPYERTLNRMSRPERDRWAEKVRHQLASVVPPEAEVVVLAGQQYREGIVPFLEARGHDVSIPLEGLSFGRQLSRLKELASSPAAQPERRPVGVSSGVEADLDRLYRLLERLESMPKQGRLLRDYKGGDGWPVRGVYFFREPGETRRTDPDVPRVVRVGTHAVSANSKSTLWGRLRAHRGGREGQGNHRGSVFRLHVGEALLQRDRADIGELPTWASGQSAPREVRQREADHERRVSEHIGRMSIIWVAIPDEPGPESQRAYIERNAIALLSNQLSPVDPPSSKWLGLHSVRGDIRASGLWNLRHVGERYDPGFLDALEGLIERMADPEATPAHPPGPATAAPPKTLLGPARPETGCPFCDYPGPESLRTSTHARAFADAYPVTDGHTLVVPLRHVVSLFDLAADELADVWRLVGEVRAALAASHDADAFNIGVNDGEAAGQTVGHAHVHVIPRRRGDVPDPRGGVRWVIPDRAPYWEDRHDP